MEDNRKISQKREKQIAKDIGGQAHVMSGGTWSKKADVSNSLFLIEDKFTHNDFYSLNIAKLNKIEKEATKIGKIPIFTVGFYNTKDNYAIIDKKYLKVSPIFLTALYDTKGKSIRLKQTLLHYCYCNTQNIFLGYLHFTTYNKMYVIMDYKVFLANNIFD